MSEATTIQNLSRQLASLIANIPIKGTHLSQEEWRRKPSPDKWSKKEILGHLIDSALNNLKRFIEIQFLLGTYQVVTYEQDHLVRVNRYQQQPIGHLLQMWASVNNQILSVWGNTKPEILSSPILLPDLKTKKTLKWLMQDYVDHMNYHLQQIFDYVDDWAMDWPYQVGVGKALQELEKVAPTRFVKLLEYGSMEVEIYVPVEEDFQQPHTRDELYVIISGYGTFQNGDIRHPFSPGDVLFVPAGVAHRFEEFTDDFKTWVIFYGPEGGEAH
ncbi:MAG: DinB family protein [Bacteroidota bacterium]